MFEPVYRNRPGADAMRPAAAEQAEQIAPGCGARRVCRMPIC